MHGVSCIGVEKVAPVVRDKRVVSLDGIGNQRPVLHPCFAEPDDMIGLQSAFLGQRDKTLT